MRERPILFSAPMVRAILGGRKTQTRRIIKNRTVPDVGGCPYGEPGERLWVRETFLNNALDGYPPVWFYRADSDDKPEDRNWKPSIFMPRAASRITLEITNNRFERLQDISEADTNAEGVTIQQDAKIASAFIEGKQTPAQLEYFALWESINGKGSWALNPWVWVIEFKKL